MLFELVIAWVSNVEFTTPKYKESKIRPKPVNPKRAGGGAESAPLQHFLLYLCRLLFFRAETSWLFFLQALRSI